ncbi:MAG TPA: glycoside hydrolase domain-containing protein [Streptosporangiaceae bacterium]
MAAAAAAGTGLAMPQVPAQAGPRAPGLAAGGGMKAVRYAGYTFALPATWPVISLSGDKRSCVRYNRHAVYLGRPDRNQACPARQLGTTQSLLIEPGPARSRRAATDNPVTRRVTVTAPRIRITATYRADPGLITQILRSAGLPPPSVRAPGRRAVPASKAAPDLPAGATSFRGKGFDACTAPSAAYMRAWRKHSPYRAVGIYIGGSDRACAQPNLSRSWLRDQANAGWHFIPMYVGPQAAYGELSSPAAQGAAAGTDAVSQAERLGFAPQTPLYYDMEAYPPGQTGRALRFLSAWTLTLHRLGFSSGVYSSSLSGIEDLSNQYFRGSYAMPDVIYDARWNGRANTRDSVLGAAKWPGHRRLHQYQGNVRQSFGGDRIDIDKDFLNIALAAAGGTPQASASVRQPGGVVDVFYRGGDRRLWRVRYRPGHGWSAPAGLGGSMRSAPVAVLPGKGRIEVFYQGTDGKLWQVVYRPGHGWRKAAVVKRMGILGGPPAAVARPGVIDVFWKGSADPHLWHGQFRTSKGWTGPQKLGGRLLSGPSPVEPTPGRVEVFWKGGNKALWQVASRSGSSWGAPRSLGMGPLGGPPRASAEPTGAVRVLWHGAGNANLWLASATPGGRWNGPRDLHGSLSQAPFPVAGVSGVIRVFWRGTDSRLWQVVRRKGGWHKPAALPEGRLASEPFAAVGTSARSAEVFWRGRGGALWSAALRSGTWKGPVRLGGHAG